MIHGEDGSLLLGAVALGALHGFEPGHGWPVAASYALDQSNKWIYGFAASLTIGVGHLVSSLAMVAAFFYAKSYFDLTRLDEPVTLFGGIQIGGPVSIVAGMLLVSLGVREYFHGHSHGSHDHSHGSNERSHGSHDHSHGSHDGSRASHDHSHGGHDHESDSHHHHADEDDRDRSHTRGNSPERDRPVSISRLKAAVPFLGGSSHSHGDLDADVDRGLFGIAWFAFVLGFAHEEEFEIIALCAGSSACLELMSAYAITVVVAIVGLTMLLIGGYEHYEERVARYAPYLPVFSAVVLVSMGLGFVTGLF